jgi:GAF domain-containing protein
VGYVGTAVLILEDRELVFAGMRGPESFTWDEARQIRYPVAGFGLLWPRLCAGEPIIIPDVYAEATEARIFRSMVGARSLRTSLAFIRSCMWVPLVVRDQPIGLLSITCPEPDGYTPRPAELALAIARQAAVAIENARLHERAQRATQHLEERTRELAALYRADETLHRSLRLEDILQALVDEATEILGADKATVLVWDNAHAHLVPGAAPADFSPRRWRGCATGWARGSPARLPAPASRSPSRTRGLIRGWLTGSPSPSRSARCCTCRSSSAMRSSASSASITAGRITSVATSSAC